MNKVESVVRNYLGNSSQNSALMIKGEWGCGKTYFLKNTLFSVIKDAGLDIIYVSLNGIRDEQQLKRKINSRKLFLNQDPNEKNWVVKKLKRVYEQLDTSKTKVRGIGIGGILSAFELDDFITLDSVLYCFDDLERLSRKFDTVDFLGYINSAFVEHKGIKVIIIGDETKRQLAEESYQKAKEKLIGWTVEYEADQKSVIENLWNGYSSNHALIKFREKNPDFLLRLIEGFKCKNLRTVHFLFECLDEIFSTNLEMSDSLARDLVYFTFVVVNEYKSGKLQFFESLNDLPSWFKNSHLQITSEMLHPIDGQNEEVIEVTQEQQKVNEYKKEFHQYLSNRFLIMTHEDVSYSYFPSVYTYVSTGYFDQEMLVSELKEYEKYRKSKINPIDSSPVTTLTNFQRLSNQEYETSFKQVIELIKNGGFNIYEYARAAVINYSLVKKRISPISEAELQGLLHDNIDKSAEKTNEVLNSIAMIYVDDLFNQLSKFDESLAVELRNIHQEKWKEKGFDNILEKFENWKEHLKDRQIFYKIIEMIPPEEVVAKLLNKSHDREFLALVNYGLRTYYKSLILRDLMPLQYDNLKEIYSGLKQYFENEQGSTLDKYLIELMASNMNLIIGKMESFGESAEAQPEE